MTKNVHNNGKITKYAKGENQMIMVDVGQSHGLLLLQVLIRAEVQGLGGCDREET